MGKVDRAGVFEEVRLNRFPLRTVVGYYMLLMKGAMWLQARLLSTHSLR